METQPQKNGNAVAAPAIGAAPAVAALVPAEPKDIEITGPDVAVGFDTVQGFNALQRIARLFSASALVPDVYKGNIANTSIALEMAFRMRANPLMVMQNLYIVHGNPGWSSKFLIATFNQCGRFTAVRYEWTGEAGKPNRGCKAWATEKSTGLRVEGPLVDWTMVVAEGWSGKKGSKWLTMPELMFMYRAAAFIIRTTAPELTMGLSTAEEEFDREPEATHEAPVTAKGVAALKALVRVPDEDPPHDLKTGELKPETPAEGDPPADSERIDPTAPKEEPKK